LYVLRVLGLIGRIPYHILQIFAALLGGGGQSGGSTKAVAASMGALAGLGSTLRTKGRVSSGTSSNGSRARRARDLLAFEVRRFELGMHDEAIKACLEAVQLNPQFSDAWGFLGNQYIAVGKLDDATRALYEAIRLNSQDAIAWADLGDAYTRKGDPQHATQALEEALNLYHKLPPHVAKVVRRDVWEAALHDAKRACSVG